MIYEKTLKITQEEADYINHYLFDELTEDDYLGEDQTIPYEVKFENGFTMEIKCFGVQWDDVYEDSTNNAETEAVLFNENDVEVCCSEVSDEFLGEWECEDDDGNQYIVNVVV